MSIENSSYSICEVFTGKEVDWDHDKVTDMLDEFMNYFEDRGYIVRVRYGVFLDPDAETNKKMN